MLYYLLLLFAQKEQISATQKSDFHPLTNPVKKHVPRCKTFHDPTDGIAVRGPSKKPPREWKKKLLRLCDVQQNQTSGSVWRPDWLDQKKKQICDVQQNCSVEVVHWLCVFIPDLDILWIRCLAPLLYVVSFVRIRLLIPSVGNNTVDLVVLFSIPSCEKYWIRKYDIPRRGRQERTSGL